MLSFLPKEMHIISLLLFRIKKPDDDELSGAPDLGDARRLQDEPGDVRRELVPGDDRVHARPATSRAV